MRDIRHEPIPPERVFTELSSSQSAPAGQSQQPTLTVRGALRIAPAQRTLLIQGRSTLVKLDIGVESITAGLGNNFTTDVNRRSTI
jgi:hypothetical protein